MRRDGTPRSPEARELSPKFRPPRGFDAGQPCLLSEVAQSRRELGAVGAVAHTVVSAC